MPPFFDSKPKAVTNSKVIISQDKSFSQGKLGASIQKGVPQEIEEFGLDFNDLSELKGIYFH